MRPAPSERCRLCSYCYSNQHNEQICLFLFEFYINGKALPKQDCPFMKDANDI